MLGAWAICIFVHRYWVCEKFVICDSFGLFVTPASHLLQFNSKDKDDGTTISWSFTTSRHPLTRKFGRKNIRDAKITFASYWACRNA
jgi:hypothetical protein